jgi:hypothetical protein
MQSTTAYSRNRNRNRNRNRYRNRNRNLPASESLGPYYRGIAQRQAAAHDGMS